MKKIFDIILGFVFSTCFIICTYPIGNEFIQKWHYWLGTAFGLGLAYCIGVWTKEKIDKLEKEIENLKKNGYR